MKPSEPALEPVTFLPVEAAFKPQIKVRAFNDLSGWISREKRIKWYLSAGRIGHIDEDKAREFQAKGYVQILKGDVKPVSEDERAEMLASMTTIGVKSG